MVLVPVSTHLHLCVLQVDSIGYTVNAPCGTVHLTAWHIITPEVADLASSTQLAWAALDHGEHVRLLMDLSVWHRGDPGRGTSRLCNLRRSRRFPPCRPYLQPVCSG